MVNMSGRYMMKDGLTQKHCHKCGGNVYLDWDYYGWYEQCLQCGYTRDLESIIETQEKVGKGNLERLEK